ncbi:hypothetical protein CVT26_011780 [Gymnopilus dilepis]|uniref:Cyclin C-terminal domain-containing protein n=1 Tax=Gymnopilus dilepis TaxID=231916 RepID=A0A409WUA0_9AGAR|nr:hypothetical protein CVT26_011780 [Gymnopilus dilepis]
MPNPDYMDRQNEIPWSMRQRQTPVDWLLQGKYLSKFLTEITLLDHRYLRIKPSLIAAAVGISSRRMIGYVAESSWNPHSVVFVVLRLMIPFSQNYAFKFLKAPGFATEWAKRSIDGSDDDEVSTVDQSDPSQCNQFAVSHLPTTIGLRGLTLYMFFATQTSVFGSPITQELFDNVRPLSL